MEQIGSVDENDPAQDTASSSKLNSPVTINKLTKDILQLMLQQVKVRSDIAEVRRRNITLFFESSNPELTAGNLKALSDILFNNTSKAPKVTTASKQSTQEFKFSIPTQTTQETKASVGTPLQTPQMSVSDAPMANSGSFLFVGEKADPLASGSISTTSAPTGTSGGNILNERFTGPRFSGSITVFGKTISGLSNNNTAANIFSGAPTFATPSQLEETQREPTCGPSAALRANSESKAGEAKADVTQTVKKTIDKKPEQLRNQGDQEQAAIPNRQEETQQKPTCGPSASTRANSDSTSGEAKADVTQTVKKTIDKKPEQLRNQGDQEQAAIPNQQEETQQKPTCESSAPLSANIEPTAGEAIGGVTRTVRNISSMNPEKNPNQSPDQRNPEQGTETTQATPPRLEEETPQEPIRGPSAAPSANTERTTGEANGSVTRTVRKIRSTNREERHDQRNQEQGAIPHGQGETQQNLPCESSGPPSANTELTTGEANGSVTRTVRNIRSMNPEKKKNQSPNQRNQEQATPPRLEEEEPIREPSAASSANTERTAGEANGSVTRTVRKIRRTNREELPDQRNQEQGAIPHGQGETQQKLPCESSGPPSANTEPTTGEANGSVTRTVRKIRSTNREELPDQRNQEQGAIPHGQGETQQKLPCESSGPPSANTEPTTGEANGSVTRTVRNIRSMNPEKKPNQSPNQRNQEQATPPRLEEEEPIREPSAASSANTERTAGEANGSVTRTVRKIRRTNREELPDQRNQEQATPSQLEETQREPTCGPSAALRANSESKAGEAKADVTQTVKKTIDKKPEQLRNQGDQEQAAIPNRQEETQQKPTCESSGPPSANTEHTTGEANGGVTRTVREIRSTNHEKCTNQSNQEQVASPRLEKELQQEPTHGPSTEPAANTESTSGEANASVTRTVKNNRSNYKENRPNQTDQEQVPSTSSEGGFTSLPPLDSHGIHIEHVKIMPDRFTWSQDLLSMRSDLLSMSASFSDKPVCVNTKVCFRFVKISNSCSDAIVIGFTYTDPARAYPLFSYPMVSSNWIQKLDMPFCDKDNILHFYVNSKGDVYFAINGEEQGLLFSGVDTSKHLWALVGVIHGHREMLQFQTSDSKTLSLSESANYNSVELDIPAGSMQSLSVEEPLSQISQTTLVPLSLHKTRGRNVSYVNDNGFAARTETVECQGYVFTEQPIRPGQTIVVQILATVSNCDGSLAIGLTSCDPATLRPSDLPDNSEWLPDRSEYWVVKNNAANGMGRGDVLIFTLTKDGEFCIKRNNSDPGIVMHVDLAVKLWAFVDLYGATRKVKMLSSEQLSSQVTNLLVEKPVVKQKPINSVVINLPNEAECTICFDNPIDCVLYKCGHMCMCYKCAVQLKNTQGGNCPICRVQIQDITRIYKI